jgi:membrane-anchored mycosin MYCP
VPISERARRQPLAGIASVLLGVFAVVVLIATAGGPAAAAPAAAGSGYVTYYVVGTTFQGQPENLAEIAGRFLGSPARSNEIFDLNAGMIQPAGGKLTNPAVIEPGWILMLPWDAVGPGVHYGLLPKIAPVVAVPPPGTPPPGTPPPVKSSPPVRHVHKPIRGCAGTPAISVDSQDQWGMLRVAPQHAWPYSRGAGVLVAIIDSGVDASVPDLAGRVTAGADIITGTAQGNTDCLGSGTAMAGIIAARSGAAGDTVGMAPNATVMPVQVAPTNAAVSAADQASAIQVAVSAGARVIALGRHIDPARPAVASAIEQASSHGVVVVAAAPAKSAEVRTASAGPATPGGAIWVGAISINGALAARYQPGTVNVVAPGVNVTSLGITGTGGFEGSGPQYAVAFVAGEAALVRARYPDLTATQVVQRIEMTADQIGPAAPDAAFGWGVIDPGTAVTRVIASEIRPPRPARQAEAPSRWSALRTRALVVTVVLALLVLLLVSLRIRRIVRSDLQPDAGPAAALAAGTALRFSRRLHPVRPVTVLAVLAGAIAITITAGAIFVLVRSG